MALQIGERQKNDTESIDWGEVHENYDESQIVINIDGASLSLSLSYFLSHDTFFFLLTLNIASL